MSSGTAGITLRPAVQSDAPAMGAVFDAAVRAGWTYLGDLAARPMFTPEDWEQLVPITSRRTRCSSRWTRRMRWSDTPLSIPKTARCSSSSLIARTRVAGSAALSSPPLTTPCVPRGARRHTCSCTSRRASALRLHLRWVPAGRLRPGLGLPRDAHTRASARHAAPNLNNSNTAPDPADAEEGSGTRGP
jgi:hypothetical protein